ncbi:MAG: peptidoglycan/LPS O-acetylase OafA/YrhL [Kiritimatiellia bacterium]|jgi:peptidoglycan/LPS O-acetylase OafA/YrhL
MINIRTPLVIVTVLVVAVLCVVRLVLLPESWASSLAALAFFPIAIGVLVIRSRSSSDPERSRKISGKLRAALVASGALLTSSLLLSITDSIGLTGQTGDGGGHTLIIMLSAIVAVATDVFSARLERKAEKDPD